MRGIFILKQSFRIIKKRDLTFVYKNSVEKFFRASI